MPPREYTIARMSRGGEHFEVLVDPENALRYKLGEDVPPSRILVYEEVYRDAKKGMRAREDELKKFFGTSDIGAVAMKIIKEGELKVTADQRRRLVEEKKRQIIDFISRNAIDPRTKLPIPAQRIELAMEEAGISIDPFIDAKQQAPKVIERLRTIMPLKVGLGVFKIQLPGDVYNRALPYLKGVGRIIREEWLADGTWIGELEAPAGVQPELIERLARLSGGRAEVSPREG